MKLFSMRKMFAIVLTLTLALIGTPARAGMIIAVHNGDTDPTTEGFGTKTFGASSTFGPLPNDLGLPAWQIAGTAQSSQFGYISPAITASEETDIASQGFTLTFVARVLQNGLAPAYDSTSPVVIGGALVEYNGRRWEVDLGLDSAGDTVAVLPTSVGNNGPGLSILAPGPSYTLVGSGSTYHTYELIYNPTTLLADLFIDGVDRIQGYGGHTSFPLPFDSLAWSAFSGGEGNFNFVELQTGVPPASAPEPSSLILLCSGLGAVGFLGLARRRCIVVAV